MVADWRILKAIRAPSFEKPRHMSIKQRTGSGFFVVYGMVEKVEKTLSKKSNKKIWAFKF